MRPDELLAELASVVAVDGLEFGEEPRLLSGGFFAENYEFRLTGAPAPWDGPLVVRLFPPATDGDSISREALVQRHVAASGFPAPSVLHFDVEARIAGRRYLVMERMPGDPMLSGIRLRPLLRDGPRLLGSLTDVTADIQARLHALDVRELLAARDSQHLTIDHWFRQLARLVDHGGAGFEPALRWLIDHRPADGGDVALCHGDLHPGNILVDRAGRVTAVLDWTVATVGEPALDVGFTTMALSLAPVDLPAPVQVVVARFGRVIARRFVGAYQARVNTDLTRLSYYEALRCAIELGGVADYRLAVAAGRGHEQSRPTWDRIASAMVRYFRVRTGIVIELPAPAACD